MADAKLNYWGLGGGAADYYRFSSIVEELSGSSAE